MSADRISRNADINFIPMCIDIGQIPAEIIDYCAQHQTSVATKTQEKHKDVICELSARWNDRYIDVNDECNRFSGSVLLSFVTENCKHFLERSCGGPEDRVISTFVVFYVFSGIYGHFGILGPPVTGDLFRNRVDPVLGTQGERVKNPFTKFHKKKSRKTDP